MIKLRKRKSTFTLFVIACLLVATVLPNVALADKGGNLGEDQDGDPVVELQAFSSIKTTDSSGDEVNDNEYEDIEDVWVDGYGGTPSAEYKICLSVSFTQGNELLAEDSTTIATDADGYFHINLVDVVGEFTADPQKVYKVELTGNYKGSKSDNFHLAAGEESEDPVNSPPVANDDAYSTTENTELSVPVPGVLTNDTDSDNDTVTVNFNSDAEHGTVTLQSDGSFVYRPDTGFTGTDSFTYTISDGTATSNYATVTITVNGDNGGGDNGGSGQDPVNNPPVATDDAYSTTENTQLSVPGPGVLTNDTDPDDDTVSVNFNSVPGHGTVTLQSDGSFVYQPDTGYKGIDSFTYTISDGTATSNYATVTITVTGDNGGGDTGGGDNGGGGQDPVNNPPVANDNNYSTDEDEDLVIQADGILGNDTDADGDAITVDTATVSNPLHGTLSVNADGSFTYEPDKNWHGTDSFVYRVWDGEAYSDFAEVTIDVKRDNSGGGGNNDNDKDKDDNDDNKGNDSNDGNYGNDNNNSGTQDKDEPIVVPGNGNPEGPVIGSDTPQPEGLEIPGDPGVAAPAAPNDPAAPANPLPKTGAYPVSVAAFGTMLLGLGVYLRKR